MKRNVSPITVLAVQDLPFFFFFLDVYEITSIISENSVNFIRILRELILRQVDKESRTISEEEVQSPREGQRVLGLEKEKGF